MREKRQSCDAIYHKRHNYRSNNYDRCDGTSEYRSSEWYGDQSIVFHLRWFSRSNAASLKRSLIDFDARDSRFGNPSDYRITPFGIAPSFVYKLLVLAAILARPDILSESNGVCRAFQVRATYRRVSPRVFIERGATLSRLGERIANMGDPYIRESAAPRVCPRLPGERENTLSSWHTWGGERCAEEQESREEKWEERARDWRRLARVEEGRVAGDSY